MKTKVKILIAIACALASTLGTTAKAQIEAYALYTYSQDNEVNFNSTYTGKTVKVVGIVTSRVFQNTEEWASGYSLWLGWDGFLGLTNGVRLFFTESTARQFANIQKGDIITIQGRCIGRGGSLIYVYKSRRPTEVYVDNCSLIKINKTGVEIEREKNELRREEEEAERSSKEAREAEKRAQKEKSEKESREAQDAWKNYQEREKARQSSLKWVVSTDDLVFAESAPLPARKPEWENGIITVKITLSKKGDVTTAKIDEQNTTIYELAAQQSALSAARKTKFNFKAGDKRSEGTIIYKFLQ
jgi:TonB family protein